MCDTLNEPILGGNQKIKQITEWEKIFDYTKNGTQYTINRMRTPQEIEEYKLQGTYMDLLKTLMYSYLDTLDTNGITITIPKLMEKMYLVNHNYSYGKYNTVEVYDIMESKQLFPKDKVPTIDDVDKFFVSTETNYRRKIKQMLREMEDEALISHPHEWLCLGKRNNGYTKIERATKDEYETFLRIQTDLLKNYHNADGTIKGKHDLSPREQFSFYCGLIEQTKKQLDCSFYSYEYEVVINRRGVREHLINNINKLEKSINNKVVEQLSKKDRYLCLIDWFIDSDTKIDIRRLLIDNRKEKT